MNARYIALRAVRAGVAAVYRIFRLIRRRDDTVVFLSRQSDRPSENFIKLEDKLRELRPDIKTVSSCRLGLRQSMGLSYIPLLTRQLWLLAGARYCVTESYCPPVSLPEHPDSLRVVQIWHSMVAIKKFGWQTVGLPEGSDEDTAKAMRMHAGYDAVVCGSEFQRELFAEAMNTPLEKIHALGTPMADSLLTADADAARERILTAYPDADNKRIIAYLPTMRRGRPVPWNELKRLADAGSMLIIGLHPLDNQTEADAHGINNIIFDKRLGSRTLMLGSDEVISDYSGAAAEAALCGRKLYFFVPDIEEYSGECGLNVDPEKLFPEICARSGAEIMKLIAAPYPDGLRERTRELLAGGCDGSSTERIARLILGEDNNNN